MKQKRKYAKEICKYMQNMDSICKNNPKIFSKVCKICISSYFYIYLHIFVHT